jgi:Flp pilus assembly protein protease CpaA
MKEYLIRLLAACIFLWMTALPDLRTKKIPVWIPGIFFAAAIGADLSEHASISRWELWAGAVPGVFLLFLSFTLRGKIGEGDGICLAVCGLFTGITAAVAITEMALVMASLTCTIGALTGRRKAGDRIAFIPFLAAAGSLFLIASALSSV